MFAVGVRRHAWPSGDRSAPAAAPGVRLTSLPPHRGRHRSLVARLPRAASPCCCRWRSRWRWVRRAKSSLHTGLWGSFAAFYLQRAFGFAGAWIIVMLALQRADGRDAGVESGARPDRLEAEANRAGDGSRAVEGEAAVAGGGRERRRPRGRGGSAGADAGGDAGRRSIAAGYSRRGECGTRNSEEEADQGRPGCRARREDRGGDRRERVGARGRGGRAADARHSFAAPATESGLVAARARRNGREAHGRAAHLPCRRGARRAHDGSRRHAIRDRARSRGEGAPDRESLERSRARHARAEHPHRGADPRPRRRRRGGAQPGAGDRWRSASCSSRRTFSRRALRCRSR